MPPDPVPVVRFRADVVVVVLRCFRVLLPEAVLVRGADSLLGERVPLPTAVELAGAGCVYGEEGEEQTRAIRIRLSC